MTIIELDPRFPTAIPLEAASLLTGEVSYTEEVPIRVRWAIADAGGHSVSGAEVLVTTDASNDLVLDRIDAGERLVRVGLDDAPAPGPVAEAPISEAPGSVSAGAAVLDDVPAAPLPGAAPAASAGDGRFPRVAEAIEVMAACRRTGEWEAGQTHASLLPYLIEEAFEFIDAVNEGGDVVGELSDLLLQVLFQAEVAEDFDIEDVAAAFVDKMRRRKPYIFDGTIDGQDGLMDIGVQEAAWDAGRGGPRSQPAQYLPALSLAEEAIRRARALGMADGDIPVELLCPTPGLELESGAEARTRAVAREFLADLDAAAAAAAEPDPDHGQ